MLRMFPLLLIPAIIYTLFALPAGAEGMRTALASPAFTLPLASHSEWVVSNGHLLTMFSIFCLFFEILKSTTPATAAIIDNSLSVGVFVICLLAFLLMPAFGTTEFFYILMMSILDFMAGFVVMISTARRTVDYVN